MVKVMCGVRLIHINRPEYLMVMLGLSESMGQLAVANGVLGMRRKDGDVLRRTFEVEGKWKKGRMRRTWKKQVEEESVKFTLNLVYVLW